MGFAVVAIATLAFAAAGFDDLGPGYCVNKAGARPQAWLCDSSSHAMDCKFSSQSCGALCAGDGYCVAYMLQNMTQYGMPPTCVLVTPNKPITGHDWSLQQTGAGFDVDHHDGETRDECFKKTAPPGPPSYIDIGIGFCTGTEGRPQSFLCDTTGGKPGCPTTQGGCQTVCSTTPGCVGFMTQKMDPDPDSCQIVSPQPPGGSGAWVVYQSGAGLEITGHDGETRDHCYKRSSSPGPVPPPPPSPPPSPQPPAGRPTLGPVLLPRPHSGTHNFSFMLYGGDELNQGDAFANLTRAMRRFGVGSGFDPLTVSMDKAAATGWPVSMNPPEGGNRCFQVPECPNNMSSGQVADLMRFDEANVYSQIQFGEWGNYFANLQPAKGGGNVDWWHRVFPDANDFNHYYNDCATPVRENGKLLHGFKTMPSSRADAYEAVRAYYNSRIAWLSSMGAEPYQPSAKIYSMTCTAADLVMYAALWNSEGPNHAATSNAGLELQTGGRANLAIAMARGGSRRFGKPFTVQPSAWGYGPGHGICGPLTCTPNGGQPQRRACTASEVSGGASCSGAEASHSYSWYWRIWFHSWFAGAAAVTEEGPAMGLFACDDSGNVLTDFAALTEHGTNAQAFQRTTSTRERGSALTPLGVLVDKYLGYGTGAAPESSWGVFDLSDHDTMFSDLAHAQLYVNSGVPDDDLQTTPHGEIADVMLSDSMPAALALYPVLILVGDHAFSNTDLAQRLVSWTLANTSDELVVQQFHVDQAGASVAAQLNGTGKLTVVSPGALPSTGRTPAISEAHLDAIGRRHLPVVLESATLLSGKAVEILWQVNRQPSGGFVIELSNPWGVTKAPCAPMSLDAGGTAIVQLRLMSNARSAIEWANSSAVQPWPLQAGDVVSVRVPPGNTTYVEFSV